MRFPEFLKKEGTIGFVAPSFGCNIEPYKTSFTHALEKFSEMGYQTKLGPNCFEGSGIGISNTPKKCAEELNEMYLSKDTDVLISCGGGELMCEILDDVDFDKMKTAKPKWYMGYSDNTNFTFLLTTICDVASIYGPCAGTFGMEPWDQSIHDSFSVLEGKKLTMENYPLWEKEGLRDEEHPLEPYNLTEKSVVKTFVVEKNHLKDTATESNAGLNVKQTEETVTFKGRLIGGCMDCLVNLTGTKFDEVRAFNERYKEDGIIWYLESCDLNVFGIRRAIWQMIHAGWFEHVKGFLIGRPLHFGEEMIGLDQYQAVLDLLKEYQVPVLMDLSIGHLPPMMTLVNGSMASVTAENGTVKINMELV